MAVVSVAAGHPLVLRTPVSDQRISNPLLPQLAAFSVPRTSNFLHLPPRATKIHALRRTDFDRFAKRVISKDSWKSAWRTATDGLELVLFVARKKAERMNRRYSVSRRLYSARQAALKYARAIERDFDIYRRWRIFVVDFGRAWPMYRKRLGDFFRTPLGKSVTTIFYIWFFMSGWLLRCLTFALWMIPLAIIILFAVGSKYLVVQGDCDACEISIFGYKGEELRCPGCGSLLWHPEQDDSTDEAKKISETKFIDIDFEER